ncbi:hypothetical protein ACET3Z_010994 [Daucus carota]
MISLSAPWTLSDDVLIPLWLAEQEHWVLGRLCFVDREFHVYSTLNCDGGRDIIVKAATPFVQLLPKYLEATSFYDRTDIDFTADAYSDKLSLDQFGVTLHHFDFTSSSIDSGIYMCTYAEYYATVPEFPNDELDISTYRSRLALLFYSYGMAKQIHGYESDSDYTAKVPSKKPQRTRAYE